jgi:hypothetical protein
MATKKDPKDEAFGRAPVPEEMIVSPAQEAIPVKPAEQPKAKSVATYPALNEDEARRVTTIKEKTGDLVTYLKTLRDSFHDAEVQRALSIAITDVETASMWAVRAVTWRG